MHEATGFGRFRRTTQAPGSTHVRLDMVDQLPHGPVPSRSDGQDRSHATPTGLPPSARRPADRVTCALGSGPHAPARRAPALRTPIRHPNRMTSPIEITRPARDRTGSDERVGGDSRASGTELPRQPIEREHPFRDVPANVLIVDERDSFAPSASRWLTEVGVVCDVATDADDTLERMECVRFDVIVVDANLPWLSLRDQLRDRGDPTPVLVLSTDDAAPSIALQLTPQDAQLVKPVRLHELEQALRALMRRNAAEPATGSNAHPARRLVVDDLVMDLDSMEAFRQARPLSLAPTQFRLLREMMRVSPAALSHVELRQAGWGGRRASMNNLRVQIASLRERVDRPFRLPLVHTVPGGYRVGYAPAASLDGSCAGADADGTPRAAHLEGAPRP